MKSLKILRVLLPLLFFITLMGCTDTAKSPKTAAVVDQTLENKAPKAALQNESSTIASPEMAASGVKVAEKVSIRDVQLPEKMVMEKVVAKSEKKVNERPSAVISQEPQTPAAKKSDNHSANVEEEKPSEQPTKDMVKPASEMLPEAVEKPGTSIEPVAVVATKPDHEAWNTLLQKHVTPSGKVNYAAILQEKSALVAYCEDLGAHPISEDWSRKEKMAYWINAYNAFTIRLIVDNYPVAKITDLEGGKPWDKKWIKLGAKTYSLNQIENDILRPTFKEPRIHFAVNCAARSCPPILNKAWTAENLEANFARRTKAFINNGTYNQISSGSAKLSKIFDWYGEDFGDVKGFINKFAEEKIGDEVVLEFMAYDWRLNE